MSDSNLENTENSSKSDAETEPQFRSLLDPLEIKLPRVKSILYEMAEKGIRLPSGLTKRIEDIPDIDEQQRFTVLSQIGQGGMSHVYRVYDRDIGRSIAVKAIKLDKSSPVNFKRALNEMQITGQLEHPNIMPLHDVGIDDNNNMYFSMKLIKGEDLGSILENLRKNKRYKGFNRERLLEIFIKVCDAVSFAHSRDVIHRDLKPHNIMVGEFGEVLLTDWGIAKIVKHKKPSRRFRKSKVRLPGVIVPPDNNLPPYADSIENDTEDDDFGTKHGAVAGTPAFMPPEQALGDIKNIDSRSDIYSLGGILYHILTYFPPFVGSLPEIIEKVVKGEIRKPTNIKSDIPKELEIIALKAMSHHKANRHHTAKELKEEVQAFLENRPIDRISYNAFDLLMKYWHRNKVVFIWAMTAAIISGIVVFIALRSHYEKKIKASEDLVRKLSEVETSPESNLKFKRAEILSIDQEIVRLDGLINSIQNSVNDFTDLNSDGLPRTSYYWQQKYRIQSLQRDKYRKFQHLNSFSNFIRDNSRGDIEIAQVQKRLSDLREHYLSAPETKNFEKIEKMEALRILNVSNGDATKATINFIILKSDRTPLLDADIRLFRMIDGARLNVVSRMIPIPYKFNTNTNSLTLPSRSQYSPVTEILDYWQNDNIKFNQIKQNASIEIEPGSYVISIKPAYLDKPSIFGFEIDDFRNFSFTIMLPAKELELSGFAFVPGVDFESEDNSVNHPAFYVAKDLVTFSDYLKYLNSMENRKEFFFGSQGILPRQDDSTLLVSYDEKTDEIVLTDKSLKDKPLTGISYADFEKYLGWLNDNSELAGQFKLINLEQYKRMNPFNWRYIWGDINEQFFRLGNNPVHYFADTNIFGVHGFNTGLREFIFDATNTTLLTTSPDADNKFSELLNTNMHSHFENTGFRLVFEKE